MLKKILLLIPFLIPLKEYGLEMPSVFSDNMILQRDVPAAVWGNGRPGETITVEFNGQKLSTTVRPDTNWRIFLAPMKADAKGRSLVVTGEMKLTFQNVLVGDVWLCATECGGLDCDGHQSEGTDHKESFASKTNRRGGRETKSTH